MSSIGQVKTFKLVFVYYYYYFTNFKKITAFPSPSWKQILKQADNISVYNHDKYVAWKI